MGQAPADIRHKIAATREQMSATVEAIAERLEPTAMAKGLAGQALSRSVRWGQGIADLGRQVASEAVAQRRRQASGRGAAP
jgi:hypothetical protein